MADILVVFHSRSGHCRMIAEALSQKRGWSLGEIVYLQGAPSYGHCARDALLRREPEIRYKGPNPSRFEVVVLVSPVWCWRLCPPIRSFLRSMHGKVGNVAVVSCMGGSGAANAVAEVERLAHRKAVATLALRQDQVESGLHTEQLQAFADEVAAFAAAHARAMPAPVAAKAA
ncbi:MAG TPA: flavodoxin [Burkholderiaceae bacterium]